MTDKKELKKQIEAFKTKIYFELENHTDNVLVFGNDRISTSCGDINLVLLKLSHIIMQISKQSGYKEKELLRGMKDMIKAIKTNGDVDGLNK